MNVIGRTKQSEPRIVYEIWRVHLDTGVQLDVYHLRTLSSDEAPDDSILRLLNPCQPRVKCYKVSDVREEYTRESHGLYAPRLEDVVHIDPTKIALMELQRAFYEDDDFIDFVATRENIQDLVR